jgi:hypothetical protein
MEPGVRAVGAYGPLALLIVLAIAFFGSLTIAAVSYPGGYDWRYRVMSSLASPEENPKAYHIAAGGMAIGGACLSLLGLCIQTSLQRFVPSKWTSVAAFFFVLAGALITVSALITPGHQELWSLQKAHAKFAQAGTLSFDLGMVFTVPALLALPDSKKWVRLVTVPLVLVPVTAYLMARILLPSLVDPNSIEPAAYPPVLGSLAFWEWIGSVTVYFYSGIIVLALTRNPELKPLQ